MGGISLDFKYPVRDDNVGVNESGPSITQTGCQVLNGNSAITLSRSRYYEYYWGGEWQMDPGFDISRIQRQNAIIEAMMAKAKSTYNPLALRSLVKSVVNDISVDNKLSFGTIYDLAEQYHALSRSSLHARTLPTVPQNGTPAGDVELANAETRNNYVDTITQFLGKPPRLASTPPLDEYGEPISIPSTTTTTAPQPRTTVKRNTTATSPTNTPPVTTQPAYDPTLC